MPVLRGHPGSVGPASIGGTVLQVAINVHPKEEMALLLVARGAQLDRFHFLRSEMPAQALSDTTSSLLGTRTTPPSLPLVHDAVQPRLIAASTD